MTGILLDVFTFMTISRRILFRMRNVSDKSCSENQRTYFIFNNFFSENRAVYEKMWKKHGTAGLATVDNIIRRICFACWITKTTDTHSEYVILIAFPRQEWFRERASVLRLRTLPLFLLPHTFTFVLKPPPPPPALSLGKQPA
jgi:hypothetical protein